MTTADRMFGEGDLALCEEMGRYSAEHTLTGVFRGLFFKFGSVNFILKRAAKAWRSHYDSGLMEVVESQTGEAEMRLSQLPDGQLHDCICFGIKGWMIRAIELIGSEIKSYEMIKDQPEPGMVTFKASWW